MRLRASNALVLTALFGVAGLAVPSGAMGASEVISSPSGVTKAGRTVQIKMVTNAAGSCRVTGARASKTLAVPVAKRTVVVRITFAKRARSGRYRFLVGCGATKDPVRVVVVGSKRSRSKQIVAKITMTHRAMSESDCGGYCSGGDDVTPIPDGTDRPTETLEERTEWYLRRMNAYTMESRECFDWAAYHSTDVLRRMIRGLLAAGKDPWNYTGSAKVYDEMAAEAGVPVDGVPAVGEWVVWSNNGTETGHVAVIDAIHADGSITYSEMGGPYRDAPNNVTVANTETLLSSSGGAVTVG